MSDEKKQIFVDTAEPKWIDEMFEGLGFEVIRASIQPSGDYAWGTRLNVVQDDEHNYVIVEEGVIVERKDISDFDGGFVNNNPHIWSQLLRMQEICQDVRSFWFIVGDTDYFNKYAQVDMKQRVGAAMSAMVRYPNVQLSFLNSDQAFVTAINKLYSSYWQDKYGKAREMPFKSTNFGSFAEYVFAGIAGVSTTRAKNLTSAFDIRFELIPKDVKYTKLEDVAMIGKKTAENINQTLNIHGEE